MSSKVRMQKDLVPLFDHALKQIVTTTGTHVQAVSVAIPAPSTKIEIAPSFYADVVFHQANRSARNFGSGSKTKQPRQPPLEDEMLGFLKLQVPQLAPRTPLLPVKHTLSDHNQAEVPASRLRRDELSWKQRDDTSG